MKSYELGLKQGADFIEQDLQLTKDGHLILMHDGSVDRVTNGTGSIKDLYLSEIKALQYSDGQKVLTLDEMIAHFGDRAKFYIETKRPYDEDMDEELIRVLNKHHLIGLGRKHDKVILQSFSPDSLKNIRQRYSDMTLIQLTNTPTVNDLDEIKTYADGVGPKFTEIDKTFVNAAHEKGLLVHPFTVNSQAHMTNAIAWGVDGFFTNYPDIALNKIYKE